MAVLWGEVCRGFARVQIECSWKLMCFFVAQQRQPAVRVGYTTDEEDRVRDRFLAQFLA